MFPDFFHKRVSHGVVCVKFSAVAPQADYDRLGGVLSGQKEQVFGKMDRLPEIASLWIGGKLSWLEQLCLKSFADQGHHITLYSYEPIPNVPKTSRCKQPRRHLVESRSVPVCRTGCSMCFVTVKNRDSSLWLDSQEFRRLTVELRSLATPATPELSSPRPLKANPPKHGFYRCEQAVERDFSTPRDFYSMTARLIRTSRNR